MISFKDEVLRTQQALLDAFDMGMRDEYAGNKAKTGKRICFLIEQKRGLGYCIGMTAASYRAAYMTGRTTYAAHREAFTTRSTPDRWNTYATATPNN